MPRLEWGTPGSSVYETGVDRGVLYIADQPGVAWTGLTSVEMNPSGGGVKSYYLDGEKYIMVSTREEFGATINALTYPDLFAQCDGSSQIRSGLRVTQQRRKPFGFSYRTLVGNELNGDLGYKIHLVYNAIAEPVNKSYNTIGDNVTPVEFSWNIVTKAPPMAGVRRTSHIEIDSRTTDKQVLGLVEETIYGSDTEMPRLPSYDEVIAMFDAFFVFVVTDNGDGTYTVSGPDDAITPLGDIYMQFAWPTVVEVDPDTYTISDG
ncbi:major tail protein [Streptomyces phage RosaAsantewaa]|nr:major tail protein [Streptomyces phage RosaAsantewaa]